MKIIEEGNGPHWSMQLECKVVKDEYGLTWDDGKGHCGSLLEIDENDIFTKSWSKFAYQCEGTDYLVKCPRCKCRLYVQPDRIPKWVKALKRTYFKQYIIIKHLKISYIIFKFLNLICMRITI